MAQPYVDPTATVFNWDDDSGSHPHHAHVQGNQTPEDSKFNQAIAIGNALFEMHQKSGKKGKKGKKSAKKGNIEHQIEALFVAGCAYLGIKIPAVVSKQVIRQIISSSQHFPQAQQLFQLLGVHDQEDSDSGSGSDSDKKHKKKKSKSGSSSGSHDKDKKHKKKKSKSGSSSGSEEKKHKKKHGHHDLPGPGGALPWAGVAAAGAYGGYQHQHPVYNPTSTYSGPGYDLGYPNQPQVAYSAPAGYLPAPAGFQAPPPQAFSAPGPQQPMPGSLPFPDPYVAGPQSSVVPLPPPGTY